MIPVVSVMTARSLDQIAAGTPMNYAGSTLFELYEEGDGCALRLVYSKEDDAASELIILVGSDTGSLLPETLRRHADAAYARLLSFVQRAKNYPVSLPRGWRQFKHNNLLAFFALPESFASEVRWIAEVNPGTVGDVAFWATTNSDDRKLLADFETDSHLVGVARSAWERTREQGLAAINGPSESRVGTDVDLGPTQQSHIVAKSRTSTQWLRDLTTDQLKFVNAGTSKSIRLRGPAGSGKTLTLAIKAVQETCDARRSDSPIRILFVTHSWSLAGEVDELVSILSELGPLREVNVLPLVAVAQEIMPAGMMPADLKLVGDDSLTGKTTQLAEIEDLLSVFVAGDWITYRNGCSPDFRERIESDSPSAQRGLAWDLLIEFGCVLGADGIFPGVNSEKRYLKLARAPWMMRADGVGDRRAIFALYSMFHASLAERSLLTSDQLLNDFLNYLEGFTWNHRRRNEGYDLIFADEFHLFNTLERQILRCLSRDVGTYPRIFMALDPNQSPWEVYFEAGDASSSINAGPSDDLEAVQTVDIPTVHRSSPQILELIKHVHLEYANLDLDGDWAYSISDVESLATPGPIPSLFMSETMADEGLAIYKAVSDTYPRASHAGTQMALAIVDEDSYPRYRSLIEDIGKSGKFSVISVTSKDDTGALKYHRKGLVVGPAEYLAGLQFDTVFVAGLPDMSSGAPNQGVRRRAALSLLYLAISRASREVRLFSNDDFGGVPEVLSRAQDEGVLGVFR